MPTLASDNFNRADNADLGAAWTIITDTTAFQITSNEVVPPSLTSGSRSETYRNVTWPDNQWSQAKIKCTQGSNQQGPGVIVRGSRTARTFYLANVRGQADNTTRVRIQKYVTGTLTNIGSFTTAWTDYDTLRLEVEGTTLRVYRNGTQLGTDITDTSIASGDAGIVYIPGAGITAAAIDDWEGGDFIVNPPGSITDLSAAAVSSTRIDLTWTPASGATSHRIERAPVG